MKTTLMLASCFILIACLASCSEPEKNEYQPRPGRGTYYPDKSVPREVLLDTLFTDASHKQFWIDTLCAVVDPPYWHLSGEHYLPLVQSTLYPEIAERITMDLVREMMWEGEDGMSIQELFASNLIQDSSRGGIPFGYTFIEFKTNPLVSDVLCFTVTSESCGANCEQGDSHFNYDLTTGNQITIPALFSDVGLKRFMNMVEDRKRKRVNDFLGELRDWLVHPTTTGEKEYWSESYVQEMIDLYEHCWLRTERDSLRQKVFDKNYRDFAEHTGFELKRDTLLVYGGRCSGHANRAIDELWIIETPFTFAELKPYLSHYGIEVMSRKGTIQSL